MDRTNKAAFLWLVCLLFIVGLFNHVSNELMSDQPPITVATGQKVDVSKYLQFYWLEPVYYYAHDSTFPSAGHEKAEWWCGPAHDTGDILTYDILDAQTWKIIKRSVVRSARDPLTQNLRANFPKLGGEEGAIDEEHNLVSFLKCLHLILTQLL